MLSAISAALQLILLIVSKWFEKDAEKKKKKEELGKELKDAIKSKDTSRINATIGRINRMRG
jgi:hypothetical protein